MISLDGYISLKRILKTYGMALSVFFLFRLVLFITEISRIEEKSTSLLDVVYAFWMGVRFDLVISGYILLFPAVVLIITEFFVGQNKWVDQFSKGWILLFFGLSFSICAADIPYFNHFFSRFSIGAFEWIESPSFVFKMIFQEMRYFLAFIPFIILTYFFYRGIQRTFKVRPYVPTKILAKSAVYFALILAMLIGIRGRLALKSPIRIGTAYFGNDPLLNQLGLNPVFTFIKSIERSKDKDNKGVQLMDSKMALSAYRGSNPNADFTKEGSIARKIKADSLKNKDLPNVVLIIMESMSASKMSRHGNPNQLTPFLDSLVHQSIYFDHTFTNGKHTFSGIYSSLFAFPSIYRQHPFKTIRQYDGMASTLKEIGYQTCYVTTHDAQFDNIEGFMRANDYDQIISQSDYPSEEIKTTLGVPDDYMFQFCMPKLNKMAEEEKPFFVSFMTASDHGPFYIPEYFSPRSEGIKNQIVEYADWSLKQFIEEASNQDWFDNTLFVFVADHGAPLSADYAISLDYHHTPLMFYGPKIIDENYVSNQLACQLDIFPTVMSFVNRDYINNTLGINLFKEQRPFVVINDDDKMAVLDTSHMLIIYDERDPQLVHYPNGDKTNYASSKPDLVKEMQGYFNSRIQLTQDLISNSEINHLK